MPTTPDMTVTMIGGERFTRAGDIAEVRKNLDLRIVDSGMTAATIYAALWYRGVKVAELSSWEDGEDQIAGSGSLNTTELVAVFAGRASTAQVGLELRIHDTDAAGDMIASGVIPCRNNPPEGFDTPESVAENGEDYMRKADYDANDDDVIDEDALPPAHAGSGVAIYRDSWTLTAQNVADKYLALLYQPDLRMLQLSIESGATPIYGEDFIVTVDPRRLTWDGLGLDGILAAGDRLQLEYTYTPEG